MPTPAPTAEAELYPECEKLKSISDDSQKIGRFLDWLSEQGMELARYHDTDGNDRLHPVSRTNEKLLADYFEIDLQKVEKERSAILASIRK